MDFEEDLDFILGYLEHSKKLGHYPEKLSEVILFLTKEIKKMHVRLCAIEEKNKK